MKDIASCVDRLGILRAQIAELQGKAKDLEAEIKDAGEGTVEGNLFRATTSITVTDRIDWKTIARKLEPSRQLVTAHTRVVTGIRLTLSARQRAAA